MVTPEPTRVDEGGFHKRIVTGQALLAVSGGLLLVILIVIASPNRSRLAVAF